MSLAHGGHLTHGAAPSFSGKNFNAIQYGLNEATGEIDYDEVERLALEHKPKMIIAGFSAYSRVIDWNRFRSITDMVGAYLFVDMAHVAGLIVTGDYPSPIDVADVCTTTTHKTLRGPRGGLIVARANEEIEKKLNSAIFPGIQGGPLMHIIAAKAVAFKEAMSDEFKNYQKQVVINARAMANTFIERGYNVVSGGTDDHLFLVSFIEQGLTGKAVDAALGSAHITVNKNTVPHDPQSPFVTSGIRVGTPAATTRGFGEKECIDITHWICDICDDIENESVVNDVRAKVEKLCAKFPVYKLNCMRCPFCQSDDTKVLDTRLLDDGSQVRRRRECIACGERHSTRETVDLNLPRLIKSDDSRQTFSEDKLRFRITKGF